MRYLMLVIEADDPDRAPTSETDASPGASEGTVEVNPFWPTDP